MKMRIKFGILLLCVVGGALLSGCSKKEQYLATTSVLAAGAGGMSFLRRHCERNKVRKKRMRCFQNGCMTFATSK